MFWKEQRLKFPGWRWKERFHRNGLRRPPIPGRNKKTDSGLVCGSIYGCL